MADLTITAANVLKGSGALTKTVVAGEALTQGIPVYKDATDGNKYKKAINDALATAKAEGITLNAAEDDQPLIIIVSGDLNPGATVVVGTTYCVSGTAGKICPDADVVAGDFKTILGVAMTTSKIVVAIQTSIAAIA